MLRITWDPRKSLRNKRLRGFGFDIAVRVFSDPHVVFIEDRIVDGEERAHAIGLVEELGIALVVYTVIEEYGDEEHIRIISARLATQREKELYHSAR